MDEDIIAILLIVAGSVISIFLYIFLHKLSNKIIHMFRLYSWSQDLLKLLLRLFSSFICIIIFLVFLQRALLNLGLPFTVGIIESTIIGFEKYFTAFIVVAFGFYLSRRVSERLRGINDLFSQYITFFSSLIVNTAFVLTGLVIVGVNIIVFLEVYKIILLVVGITLSLIVGIPFGMYISSKINIKRKVKNKSRNYKRIFRKSRK